MSADAFEVFKDAGFQKEQEMKRIGEKFRTAILETASACPAGDSYRAFGGKDASADSFMRRCGLDDK